MPRSTTTSGQRMGGESQPGGRLRVPCRPFLPALLSTLLGIVTVLGIPLGLWERRPALLLRRFSNAFHEGALANIVQFWSGRRVDWDAILQARRPPKPFKLWNGQSLGAPATPSDLLPVSTPAGS